MKTDGPVTQMFPDPWWTSVALGGPRWSSVALNLSRRFGKDIYSRNVCQMFGQKYDYFLSFFNVKDLLQRPSSTMTYSQFTGPDKYKVHLPGYLQHLVWSAMTLEYTFNNIAITSKDYINRWTIRDFRQDENTWLDFSNLFPYLYLSFSSFAPLSQIHFYSWSNT